MQLISTTILALTALATIVAALPSQVVKREKFSLFNGEKSVAVEWVESPAVNTTILLETRADVSVNCKGSDFCKYLGASCDNAFRQVIQSNTYTTYLDKTDTGTCSGTCGLFVKGEHCSVYGTELIAAYQDIRDNNCAHCGEKTLADGCVIKIDRVTGCE